MKTIHFSNRKNWRSWLCKNHRLYEGIYMLFYKNTAGISNISYDDAVEEAVCFGWIDSTVKKINEKKYVRKFTPRRDGSRWSELNIRRAKKMIKKGLMKKSGIDSYGKRKSYDKSVEYKKKSVIIRTPAILISALKKNPTAKKNFRMLASGYKKQMILWILNAKKEETRVRRMKEVLGLLAKNKKLGLK